MFSAKNILDGLSLMYTIEGPNLKIEPKEGFIVAGNRLCYDKGLINKLVEMGWKVSSNLRTFQIEG